MQSLRDRVQQRLLERFDQIRREMQPPPPDNFFDPVFDHLDELIEVVGSIRDYSTEPYMEKVRRVICVECLQQPDGTCVLRESQSCGLDQHFAMIVGIIDRELEADPGL